MPKIKSHAGYRNLPTTFARLVMLHAPRAIHDEIEYENVQELIDALTSVPQPTPDQAVYLDTLSTLFAAYEIEHHGIELSDLSPVDAIKHLMEEHGMNGSELGMLLGERSLGAKILRGNRELSKSHIRKLADHFGVQADLFL